MGRGFVLCSTVLWACSPGQLDGRNGGSADGGADSGVALDAAAGTDASTAPDANAADDGATLQALTLPALLRCAAETSMTVSFENTGASTWSPGQVALVAAAGTDGFTTTVRHELTAAVAPGEQASFDVPLVAPASGGAYTTRWRMARGDAQFGDEAARAIAVNCAGVDSIDLASAIIHTSPPGVAGWPITAELTSLDIAPTGGVGGGGIVPDFTKKDGPDRWPDVIFLGGDETIYYTLWFALYIDGAWHVAGAQQYWYDNTLRMCGVPTEWTTNLFYDPGRWGEMSGYEIAVGEIIGIFVAAGDHRSRTDTDGSSVLERSAVVLVPFPGDTAVVYDL